MARLNYLAFLVGALLHVVVDAQGWTPCAGATVTATIDGQPATWTNSGAASDCAQMACGTYTATTNTWVSNGLQTLATVTWTNTECGAVQGTSAEAYTTPSTSAYPVSTSTSSPSTSLSSASVSAASTYPSSSSSIPAASLSSSSSSSLESTSTSPYSVVASSTSSLVESASTSTTAIEGSLSTSSLSLVPTSTSSQLAAVESSTSPYSESSSTSVAPPMLGSSSSVSTSTEPASSTSAGSSTSGSTSIEPAASTSVSASTSLQSSTSPSDSASSESTLPSTSSLSFSASSITPSTSASYSEEASQNVSSLIASISTSDASSSSSNSPSYTSTLFTLSQSSSGSTAPAAGGNLSSSSVASLSTSGLSYSSSSAFSSSSTASISDSGASTSSVFDQGTSTITYTLTSTSGGLSFVTTVTSTVNGHGSASASEPVVAPSSTSEASGNSTVAGSSLSSVSSSSSLTSERSSTMPANSSSTSILSSSSSSLLSESSSTVQTNTSSTLVISSSLLSSSSATSQAFTSFGNTSTVATTPSTSIISASPGSAPGSFSGYFPNSTTTSISQTSLAAAPSKFSVPASIPFATVASFSGPLTTYTSNGSSLGIYYLTPDAPAPTSCVSYWTTSSAGNDLLVCAFPTVEALSALSASTSSCSVPADFTMPASLSLPDQQSYSGPITSYTSDGNSYALYYYTSGVLAPASCNCPVSTTYLIDDLWLCAGGAACPIGFDLAVGVTTVDGVEMALGLMPTSTSLASGCYAGGTLIDGVSYFWAKEGQVMFTTPPGFDFYGSASSTLATTPTGIITSFDASTTIDGVRTIGKSEIEVMVTPTPCHKTGCSSSPAPIAMFITFPWPILPKWKLNLPEFPVIQFPKLPCIHLFFIELGDCPKPKVEDPPTNPPTASPSPTSTTLSTSSCDDPMTITNCFDAVTVYPTNGTTGGAITTGWSTTSSQTCSKTTTCSGVPKTSMSTTTMSTCSDPQTITRCFDAVTVDPWNSTSSGTITSGYSTTSSQTCSLVTTCSGKPTTTMSTTTLTGGFCPVGITVSPDDDQGEDGTTTSACTNNGTTTVTDIVSMCSTYNVTVGAVTSPSTSCFTTSSMTVTGTCLAPTTTVSIVSNGSCAWNGQMTLGPISLTSILANVTEAIPTIGTSSSGDTVTCITNVTAPGLSTVTDAYNETLTGYSSGYCMWTGPASVSATSTSSYNSSSMITSAPTSSSSTSLQPATTAYVDSGNLVCNRRTDTGNQWYWFSPAQASLAINNFCSQLVAEDPPMVFGPGYCNQYYADYPQQYSMAGDLHVAMQWVPGDNGCPTTVWDSFYNSTCVERLTDILNSCDLDDPVVNNQYVEFWKQGGTFYRDCIQWYLEGPNATVFPTSYATSDCASTTAASMTATNWSPFVCTYGADPNVYTASGGYCQCPDGSLYPTSPATSPYSTPCGYTTQPTATTDLGSTISLTQSTTITPFPTVHTTGDLSASCYTYNSNGNGNTMFASSDGMSAIVQFCSSQITLEPSVTTTYAATYTAHFDDVVQAEVPITVAASWAEDQDGCNDEAAIHWAGGDEAYACFPDYAYIFEKDGCADDQGMTWGGAYVMSGWGGCVLVSIGAGDQDASS